MFTGIPYTNSNPFVVVSFHFQLFQRKTRRKNPKKSTKKRVKHRVSISSIKMVAQDSKLSLY
jgi:hypothetical protein